MMPFDVQSRAELVGHSLRPWFVSILHPLTNSDAYSVYFTTGQNQLQSARLILRLLREILGLSS
jgi:hypothetical protein